MQSSLKKTSNILILISAIYQTVLLSVATIFTMGFGIIVAGPIILLSWLARNGAVNNSGGWTIYGIVHTILTGDLLGLAGYICAIIDLNQNVSNKDIEDLEMEIKKRKLEKELEDLNSSKAGDENE